MYSVFSAYIAFPIKQSNWFYGWCFQSCETSLRHPGLVVIEHSVWILYWYSKIVQSEYLVLWYIVVIGRLSSMSTNIVLESFLTVKFGLVWIEMVMNCAVVVNLSIYTISLLTYHHKLSLRRVGRYQRGNQNPYI